MSANTKHTVTVPVTEENIIQNEPESRAESPSVTLPKDIMDKKLSKKSINDICDMIRHIDGMMPNRLGTFA